MRSVVLAVVVAGGCIDTPPLAEPVTESSAVEIKEVPEGRPPPLDLLIVVDDSAAMAPYRARVAELPARIAGALDSVARGWLDLRVAVTTNDGKLRRLPGAVDPFLTRSRDFAFETHQNFDGTLADALAQLMDVGADSAGPAQPLEAMRRALETSSQFLREPAPFALVTISGSDDASPFPVADYVHWTRAATRGVWWRPFALSGIYPTSSPRLDEYHVAFSGLVTPIDTGDLERAARGVGNALRWGEWGIPCLDTQPLDRDPATPELEPDCAVSVLMGDELRALPECGEPPLIVDRDIASPEEAPRAACWKLVEDRQNCGYYTPDHHGYVLRFDGYTDEIHPAYRLECRTK